MRLLSRRDQEVENWSMALPCYQNRFCCPQCPRKDALSTQTWLVDRGLEPILCLQNGQRGHHKCKNLLLPRLRKPRQSMEEWRKMGISIARKMWSGVEWLVTRDGRKRLHREFRFRVSVPKPNVVSTMKNRIGRVWLSKALILYFCLVLCLLHSRVNSNLGENWFHYWFLITHFRFQLRDLGSITKSLFLGNSISYSIQLPFVCKGLLS